MTRFFILILFGLPFSMASAGSCLVSEPNLSNPEGALRAEGEFGWFGSEYLAVIIPIDGQWRGMGEKSNYRNKFWWWYKDSETEPLSKPPIKITAQNSQTGESFSLREPSGASTGSDDYQWYSLVTILEFPSKGCWQIIATYDRRSLTVNLQVGEK